MQIAIHPVPLGVSTLYLILGRDAILVDAGPPNAARRFRRALDRLGVRPEAIRLIVLTHGHWDHVGSAKAIRELTGAKLAIHEEDRECVEQGVERWPRPVTTWARVLAAPMGWLAPHSRVPAVMVDEVLGDGDWDLGAYGIPGSVMATPGHTPGSVSVLLAGGEAFVGDLAMSGPPLRLRPGLPVFAESVAAVRESWRRLLARGAKVIFPAHGKPFAAEVLRRELARAARDFGVGTAAQQ